MFVSKIQHGRVKIRFHGKIKVVTSATGLHTLNILKAGKNKCQRLAMCLCPVFEGTLIVKYTERFVSSLLGTLIWDYFYFLI